MKNAKIPAFAAPGRVTQATLDKLVLNFVCEANQPFSVVEMPSFKTLIETLQPHTVMTRKTLCTRIQEAAKHKKSIIIKKLSAVNYVATTTDCWSARQRSYLGVTCHWIDNTSLERHSAALACRPVKGSHTFDVLAAALEEIHSEYHIREKVTRTTTDSGSNFLKAFRLYGEEEATNVQEESDSTLDDATEDQSESEEYQDVSAFWMTTQALSTNSQGTKSVYAISSILYPQLMPMLQEELQTKHTRGCLGLLLQNVMLFGIKPAGQPWLMKQWNVNASCSFSDPIRHAGAPSSSL